MTINQAESKARTLTEYNGAKLFHVYRDDRGFWWMVYEYKGRECTECLGTGSP